MNIGDNMGRKSDILLGALSNLLGETQAGAIRGMESGQSQRLSLLKSVFKKDRKPTELEKSAEERKTKTADRLKREQELKAKRNQYKMLKDDETDLLRRASESDKKLKTAETSFSSKYSKYGITKIEDVSRLKKQRESRWTGIGIMRKQMPSLWSKISPNIQTAIEKDIANLTTFRTAFETDREGLKKTRKDLRLMRRGKGLLEKPNADPLNLGL